MSKEEKIKRILTEEMVVNTIASNLKKGNPIELKIEKDRLVVVDIQRHARIKVELGK